MIFVSVQIKGAYVTPTPTPITLTSTTTMGLYTSPDYSRSQLFLDIANATSSFELMVYQVAWLGLCLVIMMYWLLHVRRSLILSFAPPFWTCISPEFMSRWVSVSDIIFDIGVLVLPLSCCFLDLFTNPPSPPPSSSSVNGSCLFKCISIVMFCLQVLVSECIDSTTDSDLATQCYNNLTAAGFKYLYKTASFYTFRFGIGRSPTFWKAKISFDGAVFFFSSWCWISPYS